MHPIANHLIQLQELLLIRDEQKVARKGKYLEELDKSIKDMTDKLPDDIRALFGKLHKKDQIVIAPISNGICSVCGMKLPISLVQAVRIGKQIHGCPNCARMLYYPESAARRISKATSRVGPRKIGISRFSSLSLMIPSLESDNADGVIRELAYKMESEGFVDKADNLVEEALRREAIASTAVDHGLAFPHVRGVEGGGLTLALGIHRKGIQFGRADKKVTKIFFFMIIPTAASAFYLKLLAGLAETFMNADSRKAITAEKDPEKLWKALCRVTRTNIK
ncbi:MAG: PTS sugar transporter subunit IIA [Lentisphaerae bacterium]|nr:PTS sugar transporter subunit IIA [Lentisphaerota bacterium]